MKPSDFHLFGVTGCKQFVTDTNMKQAVTSWLQSLNTDFSCFEVEALGPQWDKRLNVCGDSVEV
jgi:hypothetical protein